jgi:Ca2+-binding EF-hand superfamily protein
VGRKQIQCSAVDGGRGVVRTVSHSRLPFVDFRRGIEWEQAGASSKSILEPLPPLREIFRSAVEDLKLEIPKKGERAQSLAARSRRPRRRRPIATKKSESPPPLVPHRDIRGGVVPYRPPHKPVKRSPAESPEQSKKRQTGSVHFASDAGSTGGVPGAPVEKQPTDGEPSAAPQSPTALKQESSPKQQTVSSAASSGMISSVSSAGTSRRQGLIRGVLTRFNKQLDKETNSAEIDEEVDESLVGEEQFFWDDQELRNVFVKFDFDKDGELHRDQLPGLLRYLWARPEPGDIEAILEQQTPYATLSYQEFREFLTAYREIDRVRLQQVFNEADEDGSGFLEFDELHSLLSQMGYSPCVQTTLEAFSAVEKQADMKLSFKEFEGLREHTRLTEGFRKGDVEHIKTLYNRVGMPSHRGHDRITTDCWRILMYLGYPASREYLEGIVKEVDADRSGVLCFPELLKIIRLVRDEEREKAIAAVEKHGQVDDQGDRRLMLEDLGHACAEMGYYVSEEAAQEILNKMVEEYDAHQDTTGLTVEELHSFLRGYRRTDGFTTGEAKEFEEAFKREGRRMRGSLQTLEVGPVLRSFGFARTLQQVQRLVEELDFDDSGHLDFPEFVKLMRRLTQLEAHRRREVFKHFDTGNIGKILAGSLSSALSVLVGTQPDPALLLEAFCETTGLSASEAAEQLGQTQRVRRNSCPDLDVSPASRNLGTLTRRGFEAFWRHYNRLAVLQVRSKSGYNAAEVAKLHGIFNTYDRDKSGSVERAELSKMIAEYFPDATKSKQGQQDIQKALTEADANKNGQLEFAEFLCLMRKCDDRRDSLDMEQEQSAAKECGLTPEEVDGFRQIFSAHVDWRGELDLRTLSTLMSRVVDLSEDEAEDLGRIVREVHPHSREVARFPQFLRLIKRLTQDNYGGVNNAAARFVRRQKIFSAER